MFYTKTTNLWYYNIHDTENSYDTYKQTNKQTNKQMCLFPIKGPIKGKIITMLKYYIYMAEYNNNIG
jgi:hypothetical protein